MKIQVYLSSESMWDSDEILDGVGYSSDDNGELDVFDKDGAVIATYHKDAWSRVFRLKDENEEWPNFVKEGKRSEDEDDEDEVASDPTLGVGSGIPGYSGLPMPGVSYRGRGA